MSVPRRHCTRGPLTFSSDLQNLILVLLSSLQILPAARLLPARVGRGTLWSDLLHLQLSYDTDDFDRVKPLLKSALAADLDDTLIWDQVYLAVTESTPPPRPIASSLQQTPWLHSTSSFANSSEYRQDVDRVLKLELGPLYVGLRHFRKTFFGNVAGLKIASDAVFKKCIEGSSPLFNKGWSG